MTTISPRCSQGVSRCFTKRRKMLPLTAPSLVMISGLRPRRIAPINETVFHERNGLVPRARVPQGAQAWVRRMPVLQNDSSMKTSLDAFTAVMNAQKSAYLSRCSGVSRSVATTDFFFE